VRFWGTRVGRRAVPLEICPKRCTCQREWLAVVSDLPIKRLTRATREGQSKLAAEQGNFADRFKPYRAAGGESSP
jgi:hypothetical protein